MTRNRWQKVRLPDSSAYARAVRFLALSVVLLPGSGLSGELIFLTDGYFEGIPVQHGILRVAQDVERPGAGPDLAIGFMRFPAIRRAHAAPLFILPGGPGWSIRELETPPDRDGSLFELIPKLQTIQDVVVLEQRGYRHSHPFLDCTTVSRFEPPVFDLESYRKAVLQTSRQCHSAWRTAGIDYASFTVKQAADDVEALRRALGYERVNLYGNSFGSHWAMAVMRYYPDSVAHVLLAGIEGPDHTFDVPSEVLASLRRLADAAETDDRLARHIPEGGLVRALQIVIKRLDEKPATVAVPGTNAMVTITGYDIRGLARGQPRATSSYKAGLWPAHVIDLYNGRYDTIASSVHAARTFRPWTALFSAMDCASGGSPQRLRRISEDPASDIIGDINAGYLAACSVWNDADMGEDFRNGFKTDIPTVVMHGDWDISTPPENAREVLPFFTNHKFVRVRHGTHEHDWPALLDNPRLFDAIQSFLRDGNLTKLPDEVIAPIPSFRLPAQ